MTHASVFTGIGVFDLAASEVGLQNIFQVEIDGWCQKILTKRFPKTDKYFDINEFEARKYRGTIDILSGGFPCQDISISGRGEGIDGARSGLWSQYCRIISESLPGYVLIENSPQITKKGFEKILHDLYEIGYDAEWESFFASEFGKCHKRERIYVLAYPNIQGRRGLLHYIKRSLAEENSQADTLDSQRSPFLRFAEMFGEPPVFRVDDGLAKRLDAIKRLGGCGNAVVKDIPKRIFQTIINLKSE